jgi:hypothetical protein
MSVTKKQKKNVTVLKLNLKALQSATANFIHLMPGLFFYQKNIYL